MEQYNIKGIVNRFDSDKVRDWISNISEKDSVKGSDLDIIILMELQLVTKTNLQLMYFSDESDQKDLTNSINMFIDCFYELYNVKIPNNIAFYLVNLSNTLTDCIARFVILVHSHLINSKESEITIDAFFKTVYKFTVFSKEQLNNLYLSTTN